MQEAGLDPAASCSSCTAGCSGSVRQRAQELLALVELEDAADRRIKGYPGGMQRRLDLDAGLIVREARRTR